MKMRLAARLIASLTVSATLILPTQAADSGSTEKSKPIEPVAKPAIAKPTDALISKSKDVKQAEGKMPESKAVEAKPGDVKAGEAKGAESKSADDKSANAKQSDKTPAGRPINDLRVMPGGISAAKWLSAPKSQATSQTGQPAAPDLLEEKVRGLLQDKLGKDGEVVLRVSPDTPVNKPDASSGAKGRATETKPSAALKTAAETVKATEGEAAQSVREGSGPQKSEQPGRVNDGTTVSKDLSDAKKQLVPDLRGAGGHHQPWDWSGPRGPQAWGRLDPSYASCSSGKMQSPPAIAEQQVIQSKGPELPALTWQLQGFRWTRQGPLWTANLDAGSRSSFRGESYELEAIQFRFPGEPYVGKTAPAAAVHLVHRHHGRPFVIAVPIVIDNNAPRNPAIATLLRRFPYESEEPLNWDGLQINPQALIPNPMSSAMLFSGSLSHPPCSESVLWLLSHRAIAVPKMQWTEMSKLMGEGARPLQALNGRPVLGIGSAAR